MDFSDAVRPYATMESELHGPRHWARVADFGALLAELEDLERHATHLVAAFAWCHDLARVSDGADPDHGRRGAVLFPEVARVVFPELDGDDIALVSAAIRDHNAGETAAQALAAGRIPVAGWDRRVAETIVGCAWDADRLDLTRLGRMPHPDRMSTESWEDILPEAIHRNGFGDPAPLGP